MKLAHRTVDRHQQCIWHLNAGIMVSPYSLAFALTVIFLAPIRPALAIRVIFVVRYIVEALVVARLSFIKEQSYCVLVVRFVLLIIVL